MHINYIKRTLVGEHYANLIGVNFIANSKITQDEELL